MHRMFVPLAAIALLALGACNTVHGVGEDARSIGRVFSHDPDGTRQPSR